MESPKSKALQKAKGGKRIGYLGTHSHEDIKAAKGMYKENLKKPWGQGHGETSHDSWENYLPGMAHHPKYKKPK